MSLPGVRGVKLDLRPAPTPRVVKPSLVKPSIDLRAPVESQPFAGAQKLSARQMIRAQAAQPAPVPVLPHIPRLPNPTPAQTHAALQVAAQAVHHALGPKPTTGQVETYRRELHNDPRAQDFLKTLGHYTKAAQQEREYSLSGLLGRANREEAELSQRSRDEAIAHGEADAPKGGGIGLHTPLGSINLTALSAALANTHIAPKGIVGDAINEVIDLPAQTFLSSAEAGSAARSAIEGKPAALEGLGKGVLQQVEHPIRSFEEAPVSTALTLAGGEAAIGGALGRVARAGALGDRAAELASTVRPDLKLYGEQPTAGPIEQSGIEPAPAPGLAVERSYNKDPLRKAIQVAVEQARTKVPEELGGRADPNQASGYTLRREVAGGLTKIGRVDRIRAAGERTRREFVKGTVQKVGALAPKRGQDAVPLIVQGIVRTPGTLVEDLTKEAQKLRDVQPSLTKAESAANRVNLQRVEDLLADREFMAHPDEAFKAADRYRQVQRPLEAILVHGGKLRGEQLRAKLFPYAQAHMGATHFSPDDHVAAELAARDRVTGLGHAVSQADSVANGWEQELARAQTVEKIRNVIDLANRGGSEAEGAAAAAKVGLLKGRAGIGDLSQVTPLEQARAAATGARAYHAEAVQALRTAQGVHTALSRGSVLGGLRDSLGRPLSNEAIKVHMAANGVEDVGYVSHKSGVTAGGSFYKATTRFPATERHARSGAAFAKGIADHSFEGLAGSIAHQASDAAQLEVRARELSKLALVPKGQGFESLDAARHYADNNANPLPDGERPQGSGLGRLVPVHLGSDQIVGQGNVTPADIKGTLEQFGLQEHESALAKQNGKYGLIPDQVNKRLLAHDEALSAKNNLTKGLQAYQQGFRRAKLNTSTRHIAGVIQEQAIRLGAEGAGVQAKRVGKAFDENLKALAQVDEHGQLFDNAGPLGGDFRELEGLLGGRGAQVGSQAANNVVRKARAWDETSLPGKIAIGAEGLAHSTVGSKALAPWRAWSHLIEGGLTKVEQQTHHALLGKALKDSGFIDSYRSALKLQDQGMQELIKGGLSPNKADAIAKSVDDMLGNWSHQTPAVRKVIGNVAPFGLWWLNSMRWLYRLPVTHPIKTAILSALYNATRNERNEKGQGFDAKSPIPAFLQGSIDTRLPIVGKVSISPSYYSPGGTLGPEAGSTLVEQFVPQLQSALAAAKGENPLTGQKLTDAESKQLDSSHTILNVLAETLAGPLPGATQAQTLLQGGGKPYGTANILTDLAEQLGGPSQVKPGTKRSTAEELVKLFAPVRFNFPSGSSSGGSGSAPSIPSGRAPSLRQQLHLSGRSTRRQPSALQRLQRQR